MIPIDELLNRIRWDPEFGRGRLEIGFFDRHEAVIHRVAFRDVEFPLTGEHLFQFMDESGQHRRVPFHRIREVWRDGERIWHRAGGRKGRRQRPLIGRRYVVTLGGASTPNHEHLPRRCTPKPRILLNVTDQLTDTEARGFDHGVLCRSRC